MQDLVRKIKTFERMSGLDLYEEIKQDLYKMHMRIIELQVSRENLRKKYRKLKKNIIKK